MTVSATDDTHWLARQRTVATAGYNRWLLPPCALAIHLCIGMAYGFSVFWLPLSRAIGIKDPVVCKGMTLAQAITTSTCDWRVSDLTWTYSLFFVVLGASAAIWGGWLERAGPRKAGVVAACCWAGGIAIGAIGVAIHQLWLLWLGTGADRRNRAGPRLHLARLDADQMVSRSAGGWRRGWRSWGSAAAR